MNIMNEMLKKETQRTGLRLPNSDYRVPVKEMNSPSMIGLTEVIKEKAYPFTAVVNSTEAEVYQISRGLMDKTFLINDVSFPKYEIELRNLEKLHQSKFKKQIKTIADNQYELIGLSKIASLTKIEKSQQTYIEKSIQEIEKEITNEKKKRVFRELSVLTTGRKMIDKAKAEKFLSKTAKEFEKKIPAFPGIDQQNLVSGGRVQKRKIVKKKEPQIDLFEVEGARTINQPSMQKIMQKVLSLQIRSKNLELSEHDTAKKNKIFNSDKFAKDDLGASNFLRFRHHQLIQRILQKKRKRNAKRKVEDLYRAKLDTVESQMKNIEYGRGGGVCANIIRKINQIRKSDGYAKLRLDDLAAEAGSEPPVWLDMGYNNNSTHNRKNSNSVDQSRGGGGPTHRSSSQLVKGMASFKSLDSFERLKSETRNNYLKLNKSQFQKKLESSVNNILPETTSPREKGPNIAALASTTGFVSAQESRLSQNLNLKNAKKSNLPAPFAAASLNGKLKISKSSCFLTDKKSTNYQNEKSDSKPAHLQSYTRSFYEKKSLWRKREFNSRLRYGSQPDIHGHVAVVPYKKKKKNATNYGGFGKGGTALVWKKGTIRRKRLSLVPVKDGGGFDLMVKNSQATMRTKRGSEKKSGSRRRSKFWLG